MAAGDPTGSDLASGTTDGNTLSEYGTWTEREITFGVPLALTSGVKYAIVVRAPDVVGAAELNWSHRIDNPTANGDSYDSSNSGSSWSISTDDDSWFKTKASGVEKDDGSFAQDGFNRAESAHGTVWEAQTFTASSAYTISSVVLKIAKYTAFGGTVETVTVSIRATEPELPGKPTTPSPADSASSITLDETPLGWVDGGNTDTFEIYYRAQGGSWVLVGIAQAGITWAIPFGSIDYGVTYEWRVDATNTSGTTTGDTWSFDAISYDQIQISFRLIAGGNGNGPYASTPGVQGTDWEYTGESNMITVKKLLAAANNTIWYEDI